MRVRKPYARILFLLYCAAVLYLCFGDFSGIPEAPRGFLNIEADKVVHFLMFLPFPVLSYFSFRPSCRKAWHSVLLSLCILLAGSLIAAATEYFQGMLPYREADRADFLADFLALCCSSAIILFIDLKQTLRHA